MADRVPSECAMPLCPAEVVQGSTLQLAAKCFGFGWGWALPLLALFVVAERRTRRSLEGVLFGLTAAALLGATVLELHCPVPGITHRLLGHATLPLSVLVIACGEKTIQYLKTR